MKGRPGLYERRPGTAEPSVWNCMIRGTFLGRMKSPRALTETSRLPAWKCLISVTCLQLSDLSYVSGCLGVLSNAQDRGKYLWWRRKKK